MKKVILFLFVLASFISLVSALDIQKNPITDTIIPEFHQPANFSLVTTDLSAGYYQVYTLTDVALGPKGYFYISPNNPFTVLVYPTDNLNETGYYSFTYFLRKDSGANFEDKIIVNIVKLKDAIEISSDTIDPNNEKATFYIKNKANAQLKNVKARFTSAVFNEEKIFNLEPMQTTEIDIDSNMANIAAGSYIVNTTIFTDLGVQNIQGTILIGEKKTITTSESSNGLLIHENSIIKTNTGNVPILVAVTVRKNIISRIFTTFNIEPTIIERKGLVVVYTWNKKLQPSDSFSIISKTNLVLPFLLIIFGVLLVMGFMRYNKTKVDVLKSVSYVKTKGGEFALKIKIKIKAKHFIQNVSLTDKMPGIVQVFEKAWTVKPSKVDETNKRVTWNIGDMQAGEEREFSYIIYSKVGIVGRFGLPEALVVFEKSGKLHEAESNQVFFLSEQIKKEEY